MAKPEAKAEAVRLRVEERRSLPEIAASVVASKGSLSAWLKPHPLSDAERGERRSRTRKTETVRDDPTRKRRTVVRFRRTFATDEMDQITKGRVAEMAVALRLASHGMTVLRSIFDGSRADLVVGFDGLRSTAVIQVKWISLPPSAYGRPAIALQRKQGVRGPVRRTSRYTEDDFDFIVGYDFVSDTAYVFSQAETSGNSTSITVTDGAAENWGKVAAFVGG